MASLDSSFGTWPTLVFKGSPRTILKIVDLNLSALALGTSEESVTLPVKFFCFDQLCISSCFWICYTYFSHPVHPWAILFFTIHTIFHDISIWCNISRYFHDIFQAVNWSKICLVSTKICPGSIYVEIFATKMLYLYFFAKMTYFIFFFCRKA